MKKILFSLSVVSSFLFSCQPQATQGNDATTESRAEVEESNSSEQGGSFFKYASLEEARKNSNGKLIFLDFTASWCGPCQMMERGVFSDEQVHQFMNENYVTVQLDVDSDLGSVVASEYGVRSIPCYFFMRGEEVVQKQIGAMSKVEFLDKAKEVLEM